MKKVIILIALVAFIGVMAAPVSAAPSTQAVEMVKDHHKDDKKDDKNTDNKSSKADCSKKSDCCKSKSGDKKDDKKTEKK
jgi:hypothetical protein